MLPLVSILIPAYNASKWIKSTTLSALSQTWLNKEVIIVDDGSTDETLDVVKEIRSPVLKIYKQKNLGACAARNYALELASGDFIQWLDADDILAPDKIENQLLKSDQDPNSLTLHSCSWGLFYHCTSMAKITPSPLWQDLSPLDWLLKHFGEGYMMPNLSWLVSRKLSDLAGKWNESLKVNQDGEYFSRVVRSSQFIKFHSDALCYYRKGNPHSISGKNRSLTELSYTNGICVDNLLEFNSDRVTKEASIRFLQSFLSKFFVNESYVTKNIQKRIMSLGGEVNLKTESYKYYIVRKIFGRRIALELKTVLWQLKINFEKWIEWCFCIIGYK